MSRLEMSCRISFAFFFFNDTATTEIYTLSLHDALPISCSLATALPVGIVVVAVIPIAREVTRRRDRKSTRLNSSHQIISYAVFCLKKKKKSIHKKNLPRIQDRLAHHMLQQHTATLRFTH